MNCVQGYLTLDEWYTYWLKCSWTVYWVTRILLNCQLVVLNFVELSQALAELHAGWFALVTVNCLVVVLNLAKLSQALATPVNCMHHDLLRVNCLLHGCLKSGWTVTGSSWTVYMQCDFTLAELLTGLLKSSRIVTGSSWTACRVLVLVIYVTKLVKIGHVG